MLQNTISNGGLHLPHQKAEDLASCYSYGNVHSCNSVYWMYLMERFTGKHTIECWYKGRITQTHLLKLNGGGAQNEPRIELPERPFVHNCLASKKGEGYTLHEFLYWAECLTNYMGDGPCHLPDIPYYMFYVTISM